MLYERLIGSEEPKISVHAFFAAMQEYAMGTMTGAQVVSAFGLDADEQAEAVTLYNKIIAETGSANRRIKALEFENVLILGESGIAPFTSAAAVKTRLGV